ncbi:MAG: hypothetical protein QNK37_34205 [Acidobacteriota bacterium]|nr:hypothetical protein [Acidobacteriota bacterium]
MKVMIIPEDPTYDQYILKPIVTQILTDLGKPNARVEVLREPHLNGVSAALDAKIIEKIVADNPMIDLFLLMVDRDCNKPNHNENRAAKRESEHEPLLACVAVEEVEVWLLALHRSELNTPWREIRAHCHPKETWCDGFLAEKGWGKSPGRGRKRAMSPLGKQWPGLLQVCPELTEFKKKMAKHLAS